MKEGWPQAIFDQSMVCKPEDEVKRVKTVLFHLVGNVQGKTVVTYGESSLIAVSESGGIPQLEGEIGFLDDVIDHMKRPDSQKLLRDMKVKKLYVRCHPWSSRHATHNWLGPAYNHLFNKPNEKDIEHSKLRVSDYENFFLNAGWKITRKITSNQELEEFFDRVSLPFSKEEMEVQFIDFELEKHHQTLMV